MSSRAYAATSSLRSLPTDTVPVSPGRYARQASTPEFLRTSRLTSFSNPTVDTVLLKRLYVLLYMELVTRRVIWFAVTDRPDAAWVTQQARNVSWELQQLGVPARFLIHAHDAKYGGGSDRVFAGDRVVVIRTPIAAPKANSHMERQIGSTRRECL